MQIGKIIHLGKDPSWYLEEIEQNPDSTSHPHTIGHWKENNTLYLASKKLNAFGLKIIMDLENSKRLKEQI